MFDPTQKTLLADKGEIRVGSRYQTEVQQMLKDVGSDNRTLNDVESIVWTPNHALSDKKIDQFLVVSRSVGTFARSLDSNSSVKQPSLHMSAAAASRDITLVSVRATDSTLILNYLYFHIRCSEIINFHFYFVCVCVCLVSCNGRSA